MTHTKKKPTKKPRMIKRKPKKFEQYIKEIYPTKAEREAHEKRYAKLKKKYQMKHRAIKMKYAEKIKQALAEARREERDLIAKKIGRYFVGLIMIPDPQATVISLLRLINPTSENSSSPEIT